MQSASRTRAARYVHLVLLSGALLLLGSGAANAAKATFTLQSIRGRVEMQRGGKGEWAAVERGTHEASVGDRVRTGKDSSVIVVTGDGGRVSLGAETEVVLREPDRPRGWRLILGRVKAFFTANKGLEVRTPSAVAAVEGTTLQLEVAADGTTVLTVAEGAVRFYNDFGSVTVLSSQQSTAAVGQPPTRPIIVDPSSLMAWEASVQTLLISPEVVLVSSNPARLQQELTARRAAVAQHPDDPEAHVALAEVLIDLHHTEEAIAQAQRAAALAPEAGPPQGVLGYALLQAGRPAAAREAFAKAAAVQPEEARWQSGLGLVALGENNIDAAIACFSRAAALAPRSATPRAYLAAAFLRKGDLAKAAAAANEAVTLAPDSGLARSYQAYVLLAQGDTSGAVAAARQAVAAAPQSALAREALGTALTFSGQYAAADTELACALSLNPASAGAHLARAKLLAAEGYLEEALAEAKLAVALDPKSAPARSTLGLLFILNNDPRHAGKEFEQALALNPSLSEARTGWGEVLFTRGRFREALEQQKLAVALDTGSAAAENNLGGIYASLGRMKEAREHLLCAIQLQPNWGMPYANLAAMYLELNLIPEALEAAERAVALGEQSAFTHTVLARIYLRQGRASQALTELRIAVALDNLYPLAHYQLARIYLDEGRSRDAVREILFAVTTDPSAMLDTRLYARTELGAEAGSYSQWAAEAHYSAQAAEGQLSYYLSGLLDASDGWRPVNQASSERFFELIAGDQPRATQQLALFSTYLDRDNGLPGPETPVSAGDPDDQQDFTGYDGVLAYRQRLSRRLTSTLKYTYRHDELDFRNPDSLTDDDDNPFLRLTHEDAEYSPELRLDANLNPTSVLSMGYAHLSDHIDANGVASVFDPDTGEIVPYPYLMRYVPDTNTAWLQVDSRVSPQFDLTVGGLWGREEGADHVISPRIVALYFPDCLSWWAFVVDPVFRSDIAELAPVEALANPYGLSYLDFAGGGVGRTYQLEYQRQGSRVSTATASLAYQQVRDLLVNIEDPEWTGLPPRLLLDDGNRWIARAAYEQWLTSTVTGRAWVQWQTSEGDFPDLGISDTEWPYTPAWQAGVRADYISPSGLQVGLEAVSVDERFANAANTETVPGYTVLNLLVQYQHGLRHSYFVTVANLTGKDYDTYAGFPQAGRSVVAGFTYRY